MNDKLKTVLIGIPVFVFSYVLLACIMYVDYVKLIFVTILAIFVVCSLVYGMGIMARGIWSDYGRDQVEDFLSRFDSVFKKQIRIKTYKKYLDGGTIEITTYDDKIYCYDHRIGTTTRGRLYAGYPKDDNSNIIEDSKLEHEVKQAFDNLKMVNL